jgi:glycosyltransferase involved in cell wall biosynthesis
LKTGILKKTSENPLVRGEKLCYAGAAMDTMLSLITPVFNEPKIHENLPIIDHELSKTGLPYEIIAVNDGSDAVTTTLLNGVNLASLRTFTYAANIGKGFALRYAFEQSRGSLICLMDADLQLHPQQIALFTNLMTLVDADVVIGSKRHPLSQVDYGPRRRLYSWGYQQLVRLFFNLNITDTQVGLKLFKRHVLEAVIPRLVVKQWAFDLELLVVARHLGYRRILEAPIRMTWREGKSSINWKVIPGMLQDTLAIYYRTYLKRQYDQAPRVQSSQDIPVIVSGEVRKEVDDTSRSPIEVQGIIYAADKP